MILTVLENPVAASVATLSPLTLNIADSHKPLTGKAPELPGLGSLSPPNARAVGKEMAADRLAALPALRQVTKMIFESERGAIKQMRRGESARVAAPPLSVSAASDGGALLHFLFSPSATLVRTGKNGLAPLQGLRPSDESLAAIEAAFTPQRIGAFSALSAEQKVLARSVLADLLSSLQSGAISNAAFYAGVGLMLEKAQQYMPPWAPTEVAFVPPVGNSELRALFDRPVPSAAQRALGRR